MPDRFLPAALTGLTGLTGLACALCCVVPVLLAAGVLGGATWVGLGQVMPGIAVVLAVMAGGAWWWAIRRRRGHPARRVGGDCSCVSNVSAAPSGARGGDQGGV